MDLNSIPRKLFLRVFLFAFTQIHIKNQSLNQSLAFICYYYKGQNNIHIN